MKKKAQRKRFIEKSAGKTAEKIRETTKKPAKGVLEAATQKKPKKLGMLARLGKKYGWSHIRPERILDWFTDFKESGLQTQVFDKALKAEKTQLENTEKTFKEFQEINKNINMAETLNKPYMEFTHEGKKLELTLDQMMFVYANSQNPGNRAHLNGTGFDNGLIDEIGDIYDAQDWLARELNIYPEICVY